MPRPGHITPLAANRPPLLLTSLADLPSTADVLLLDQFGVLHDGRTPYPGTVEAVRSLAESGRTLIVLSNSSLRADAALAKLQTLGFDRSWFAGGAVTSGEVAHDRLLNRPGAWWRALGHRVLHVTWGARGAVSLDGLGLTLADAASADFILAHGTEAMAQTDGSLSVTSLDGIKAVLRVAAARTPPPPFLCANPDLVTVDGGELRVMPGTLAAFYKDICGGDATVVLLGKPGRDIYSAALARVRTPPPPPA